MVTVMVMVVMMMMMIMVNYDSAAAVTRVSSDVEGGRVSRHTVVHVLVPSLSALGCADSSPSLTETRLDVLRRQRHCRWQPLPQSSRTASETVVLYQRPSCRLAVLQHTSLRFVNSPLRRGNYAHRRQLVCLLARLRKTTDLIFTKFGGKVAHPVRFSG